MHGTLDSTVTGMDLARVRETFDSCLAAWLDSRRAAENQAEHPVHYAVLAPGKRIRPLLLLASWRAITGRTAGPQMPAHLAGVFDLAAAPELVHTYSLVHDDLPCMDDDELRRGRPTVHVVFGTPTAVITGAFLIPLAVLAIVRGASAMGLSDEVAGELVCTLMARAGGAGMVGGQMLDLGAEHTAQTIESLENIHRSKTGCLIAASCAMGGIAAAGTPAQVARLTRFGEALGLAFQAVDDILDVTGSEEVMGKRGGRDAELGKATMTSLRGLAGARARATELIDQALAELEELPEPDALREIAGLVLKRDR